MESPWPSLSTDQLCCERLSGKDPAVCENKDQICQAHKLKAGNYSTQLGKGLETSHFHILHMTPVHFDVGFFSYFSALIGHTEENERILQYISLSFTVDSAKHPANKR